MGVFSFMETFFFISLGITFVMIIMLVYHFKQRMLVVEHKQDTMFEIINNIVKQIKNMQTNITYLGENHNTSFHPSHESVVTFSNGFLPPNNMHEFDIMFNEASKSEPRENTSEGSDDVEEEEEDSEEDSEEEDEDSEEEEEESDEDEEDEEEENTKIVVSDDDNQVESTIKIINVDINDTPESNDLGIVEMSEIESTLLKENVELNDEDIVIRKIENTKTEEVANESIKDNKEIYKKMSLSVLRATAIEKGVSTDPSKLKKQELVQLLESAE